MFRLIQRYYIVDIYEIHHKMLFNVKSVKSYLWKTSLCKYNVMLVPNFVILPAISVHFYISLFLNAKDTHHLALLTTF